MREVADCLADQVPQRNDPYARTLTAGRAVLPAEYRAAVLAILEPHLAGRAMCALRERATLEDRVLAEALDRLRTHGRRMLVEISVELRFLAHPVVDRAALPALARAVRHFIAHQDVRVRKARDAQDVVDVPRHPRVELARDRGIELDVDLVQKP